MVKAIGFGAHTQTFRRTRSTFPDVMASASAGYLALSARSRSLIADMFSKPTHRRLDESVEVGTDARRGDGRR